MVALLISLTLAAPAPRISEVHQAGGMTWYVDRREDEVYLARPRRPRRLVALPNGTQVEVMTHEGALWALADDTLWRLQGRRWRAVHRDLDVHLGAKLTWHGGEPWLTHDDALPTPLGTASDPLRTLPRSWVWAMEGGHWSREPLFAFHDEADLATTTDGTLWFVRQGHHFAHRGAWEPEPLPFLQDRAHLAA